MSEPEFIFSLELSDEARFDEMVKEVAAAMLAFAGCAGEHVGTLTGAVRDVLASARGQRQCGIRFQARDGKLRLVVSCAGHPRWETDLALPNT